MGDLLEILSCLFRRIGGSYSEKLDLGKKWVGWGSHVGVPGWLRLGDRLSQPGWLRLGVWGYWLGWGLIWSLWLGCLAVEGGLREVIDAV
jgi:hypothetical protein